MSFGADVAAFERKVAKRIRVVGRGAVQETINEANTPIAKGGRMPVDTGFLRASGAGAVGQMPAGQSINTGGTVRESEGALAAILLRWDPSKGEEFYYGWTANYARFMEYRYGFMRGAAENWEQHVEKQSRKAQAAGL
jgi:hypothetical protein